MKSYELKDNFNSDDDYPCDFPIDLVVLWCDDTAEFVKKRAYWQQKLRLQQDQNIEDIRWKTVDELKYLLRSVEMYAPWVNHIFIVTDHQKPEWLNLSHPKITIINHTQIMPADSLPTFNSVALEAYIHTIPQLAEHFIYANDDTMFSGKVKPQFFFDINGNPIVRFRADFLFCDNNHARQVLHSYEVLEQKYKIKFVRCYHLHHNIDAYRKSYYADAFNELKSEFELTGQHKFREDTDIQRTIISVIDIMKNRASLKVLDIGNTDSEVLWDANYDQVYKPARTSLICVNKPTRNIHAYLENHYPKSSCFEKKMLRKRKKYDFYRQKSFYRLFGFIPLLKIEEK